LFEKELVEEEGGESKFTFQTKCELQMQSRVPGEIVKDCFEITFSSTVCQKSVSSISVHPDSATYQYDPQSEAMAGDIAQT